MSDFNQKTADRSVYLYSVGFDFFHLELIFLNRRKKPQNPYETEHWLNNEKNAFLS